MQLPDNELYDFMTGTFLKPEVTLTRLIKISESEENEKINKTVAKNRFRVPTGPRASAAAGGNSDAAKYTILSQSMLPRLYQDLMNISNDDDLRRLTEVKLLKHKYQLLKLSPKKAEKENILNEVQEMASGMVIVDSPDPTPWRVSIDWQDVKEFKDLDLSVVSMFVEKFPREGLAKVLDGFLHSEISPFTSAQMKNLDEKKETATDKQHDKKKGKQKIRIAIKDDPETAKLLQSEGVDVEDEDAPTNGQNDPEIEKEAVWKPAEVLEAMAEGFASDQDSILCYRILGAFYLRLQEYETAVDIAQRGLEAVKKAALTTTKLFPNGKDNLSLILGTAYIYYQAPKNYDIAIKVFDFVLKHDSKNIEASIGKGLILREKRQFKPAIKLLKSVIEQSPTNFQALFEYSWCLVLIGEREQGRKLLEKCLEMMTGSDPLSVDYRAQIWWRIGSSLWDYKRETKDNDKDSPAKDASLSTQTQEAFKAFVQSLQENPNYAPAYTSLGFFYSKVLKDTGRSSKCFYKAFEIDGGELDAAYQLATEFAEKGEWELVEVIASRVVESDRLRTYSGRESSWPYRALGIVGLNQRDYAKTVQYFQKSLRITPKDSHTWLGLGEAYANSGRYVAAAKAYERAKALDPDNRAIQYQYALVLREMQEFDKALTELREIGNLNLTEFPVGSALLETYILSAKYSLENDFYGDAVRRAIGAIDVASEEKALLLDEGKSVSTSFLWKGVGDACEVFLTVESKLGDIPLDKLTTLFGDEISVESNVRTTIIACMIKALQNSSETAPTAAKGLAAHNLGLAYLKAHHFEPTEDYLHESISCFKKAIQTEPRNTEFWNAYGIASHSLNARVSQHCFIRSLGLNPRQPRTWSNLALLYMAQGDLELASEAIDKAQAVDPDFVVSWVCQAVIDATLGNTKKANNLFEHSYTISKGNDGLAKFLYGLSVLESSKTPELGAKGKAIELDTGVLALQKYLLLSPDSYLGLTVQGMLLERTAGFTDGIKYLEALCKKVEADYDQGESENDLVKYARAKTQLARLRLGAHQFNEAVEDAQTVLQLLNESPEYSTLLLSSSLVAGIGLYFCDQFGEAIEYFKTALEVSGENQDVVILLVQVLWANGGDEEREVALEQLYSSIGNKGSSVKMTLLLGVIGLLNDPELLDAAGDELQQLSLDDLVKDRDNSVQEILSMIQKSNAPWQKALYMWPSRYGILKNINLQLAVKTAESLNSLKHAQSINAEELSVAYNKADGSIQAAQRAVFYSPWTVSSWDGLKEVLEQA
ncbi:SKI complex subunit tetratricopeptide repeat protein SKI3 [Sugiyamaella lignohabitans]|uniref:SKI complex subunit tetratricopeptide repeat protein SKI3 n=1 Tax=Sugiyamaella lignohabitans TaxID=796027 RepID=A0A161HGZ1_9ASCO|nr:SKI complex subunit tetratricopeptide repeat protein SKI3 [Sugiyamaella lignohabitans]ANB15110.1 SKI complex subunit tetratricopeptide repeat protein SKI3 [Sugiyamaella lignohabitans]